MKECVRSCVFVFVKGREEQEKEEVEESLGRDR